MLVWNIRLTEKMSAMKRSKITFRPYSAVSHCGQFHLSGERCFQSADYQKYCRILYINRHSYDVYSNSALYSSLFQWATDKVIYSSRWEKKSKYPGEINCTSFGRYKLNISSLKKLTKKKSNLQSNCFDIKFTEMERSMSFVCSCAN